MAHQRVVWSPAALADVDAVATYIVRDSLRYAASKVGRLKAAAEQLAEYPHLGRMIPELDSESIPEVLVSSYRLPNN